MAQQQHKKGRQPTKVSLYWWYYSIVAMYVAMACH